MDKIKKCPECGKLIKSLIFCLTSEDRTEYYSEGNDIKERKRPTIYKSTRIICPNCEEKILEDECANDNDEIKIIKNFLKELK